MKVRQSLLVAVAAVAALSGCDDRSPFGARFQNNAIVRTAYAMNGTHPALPSAVSIRGGSVVQIDSRFQFDIAFDMDEFGFVTVHSARAVASELTPVNRVGFHIDSVNVYEQITQAPTSGYHYDTSFALRAGRTLLIDVIDGSCQGQSFLGFNIRAKLKLDSVNVTNRAIYFRMLSNPNCGFRSLVEGLPKD